MKTALYLTLALVAMILLGGGGLQKTHAQTVDAQLITTNAVEQPNTDTMDCFNYEINLNMMFDLQSKRLYAYGRLRNHYETKINNLRPSLINTEIQCLGYGTYPN